MTVTITVAGVRGGQGTSTTAAALALFAARRTDRVELVAHDLDTMAALVGVPTPADPERGAAIAERLTLRAAPSPTAAIVITDAGLLRDVAAPSEGLLLAVLRGPCYLSMRGAATGSATAVDGIVVVREHGRSLTRRDVTDITGIPTVAETRATPAVARTIDAGVLTSRAHRLADLAPLDHWLQTTLTNTPTPPATRPASTAVEHPRPARIAASRIDTDLPVALSATGRERRGVAFSDRAAHSCCHAERRKAESGSRRVLRRRDRVFGGGLLRGSW
jgi:hypothetical protein